ncbi:hypothetical protein ACFL1H_07100, partial [Nanoarchaeota archaeon]
MGDITKFNLDRKSKKDKREVVRTPDNKITNIADYVKNIQPQVQSFSQNEIDPSFQSNDNMIYALNDQGNYEYIDLENFALIINTYFNDHQWYFEKEPTGILYKITSGIKDKFNMVGAFIEGMRNENALEDYYARLNEKIHPIQFISALGKDYNKENTEYDNISNIRKVNEG